MAIGAGIGALAGAVVYGAKTAFSKERTWSWRDAAAHAAGRPMNMTGPYGR